jgi:hypothetical protein
MRLFIPVRTGFFALLLLSAGHSFAGDPVRSGAALPSPRPVNVSPAVPVPQGNEKLFLDLKSGTLQLPVSERAGTQGPQGDAELQNRGSRDAVNNASGADDHGRDGGPRMRR